MWCWHQFATGLATSSPQPGDNPHIPATTLTMPDFKNKCRENRSLGQITMSNCNGEWAPRMKRESGCLWDRRIKAQNQKKMSLVQSSINFPLAKLNRHPGNSPSTTTWRSNWFLVAERHFATLRTQHLSHFCAGPSSQSCPLLSVRQLSC